MTEVGIGVYCRVRPRSADEVDRGAKFVAHAALDECSLGLTSDDGVKTVYPFDRVFGEHAVQDDVYDTVAAPMVDYVLNGVSCAVLAYGATGSGKTHTMAGDEGRPGVMPRLLNDVFAAMRHGDRGVTYHVSATYVQVYMEKIFDLMVPLTPKATMALAGLKLVTTTQYGETLCYIKDVIETPVSSVGEVMAVLRRGERNRCTSATKANEFSSRSHSLFMLKVIKKDHVKLLENEATLYLVDLAGSENAEQSGHVGDRLEEGKRINTSLLSLKGVISALVEKQSFVPYRNSALTQLLRPAFGGVSRTALICCVGPSKDDEKRTVSTCLFGQTSRSVKNIVRVCVRKSVEELQATLTENQSLLLELREQIMKYQHKLKKLHYVAQPATARPGTAPGGAGMEHVAVLDPDLSPDFLRCPLTRKVMVNPVIANDGRTYEKSAVCEYYARKRAFPAGPAAPDVPGGLLIVIPNSNADRQIAIAHKRVLERENAMTRWLPRSDSNYFTGDESSSLSALPFDCVAYMAQFLSIGEIMMVRRTSQLLCDIMAHDAVWEFILLRDGHRVLVDNYDPVAGGGYYQLYWEKYFVKKQREGTAGGSARTPGGPGVFLHPVIRTKRPSKPT
jgi:hypothetical protein